MDKKLIFFLALLFSINVFSQDIPQVPEVITVDKIRLKINEDARNEIQIEVDALHANKKYFNAIIDKINIYFPVIEEILEEENVPIDFKYLSLQESSLIPDAVSSSNAVGFWQFKSTTAKTYGLNINNLVDERRNVVSSTRAAAKYLKNSNFVFDNWIFSLLSYMTGLSGARSILDEKFYGSKRMEINKNTHWYIKRFLAHKIAYQDEINKDNYNDKFTIYKNYEAKSIEDLSESLSVNLDDLKSYNKWLKSSELPRDKVYSFLVPLKSKNLYSQIKSSVISKVKSFISSSKNSLIDEKIKLIAEKKMIFLNGLPSIIIDSDDTMNEIFKLYSISKKSFFSYNDIDSNHQLQIGVPYYFVNKRNRGRVQTYIRRKEESLWEISQIFGIKLKKLEKFNEGNLSDKIILRKGIF
ncbi:MAG: transglycosylase SLT domain-containing protein [Bacteroidota bacterium]|nr:transglycosylase SLT domain-containing protein [Bacteroidota bacterium]